MNGITQTLHEGDALIRRVANGWHVTRIEHREGMHLHDEPTVQVAEFVYRDRHNKPNAYAEAASLGDAICEAFQDYLQQKHQPGLSISVQVTGYAAEEVPQDSDP